MRQRDTAIEPKDVEGAFEFHRLFGLLIGKFLDANYQGSEVTFQLIGDRFQFVPSQCLDIPERWRVPCRRRYIPA